MALQAKLAAMEATLRQEQEELARQTTFAAFARPELCPIAHSRMIALEKQELALHPENAGDGERPTLSDGDDAFTREMREHGLRHVGADSEVRALTFK